MATRTTVTAEAPASARTPLLRRTLLCLHLLLGTSAVAAGQALARKPGGEALTLDVEWLKGSPFPNYLIPGLFLAIVIGGTNLASALCSGAAPTSPHTAAS